MPQRFNFEIVPISEVPMAKSAAKVLDLEAVLVDDGQASAASPGMRDRRVMCYEVIGAPPGQKVWIRQEDGKCHLVRELCPSESEWLGEYPSVQDALQALSGKLN